MKEDEQVFTLECDEERERRNSRWMQGKGERNGFKPFYVRASQTPQVTAHPLPSIWQVPNSLKWWACYKKRIMVYATLPLFFLLFSLFSLLEIFPYLLPCNSLALPGKQDNTVLFHTSVDRTSIRPWNLYNLHSVGHQNNLIRLPELTNLGIIGNGLSRQQIEFHQLLRTFLTLTLEHSWLPINFKRSLISERKSNWLRNIKCFITFPSKLHTSSDNAASLRAGKMR